MCARITAIPRPPPVTFTMTCGARCTASRTSRRTTSGVGIRTPRHPSRGVRIPTPEVVRREVRLAVQRAPQVMVKVTGGGRGMAVIRAHMNYIDREGDGLIDQSGERHQGREARREIARQWAREGTPIPERSERREAFNIMWSMPAGTDPKKVLAAVQAVAVRRFAGHKYVMALHKHQANPHVHLL